MEKERRRNRWGRGSVCRGCWYGARSRFAHHLPSSRDPTPFRGGTWPIFGFLCSRRFFYFNVFLLFIFLHSPFPIFCSLTSSPSVSVSNCSATLRRRLSRRPPLLCSRRWQNNFVNVTRDLTNRNVYSVGN